LIAPDVSVHPAMLSEETPRQPAINHRLTARLSRLGLLAWELAERQRFSILFWSGASVAHLEPIAIWPPLATAAFGVSKTVVRVVPKKHDSQA
jgi:hypothetical protein